MEHVHGMNGMINISQIKNNIFKITLNKMMVTNGGMESISFITNG